jgi:nucleoside-diphosphate-sugar epimerase
VSAPAAPGVVAVTGAGGFIGSYVVTALQQAGFAVRSLLGPPGAPISAASRQWSSSTPAGIFADICDDSAILKFITGVDLVVHLAGPPSVAESLRHPAAFARAHVEGTACVLEACRQSHVTRLVYVSSAEVYGRPETTFVSEDHPLSARSPYGAAKIGAEAMIAAFAAAYDLRAIILRPFSVYGPGASEQSLLGHLIRTLRSGGPVTVHDLRPVRDYTFVADVASAVAAAVDLPFTRGVLCCNVGTMRGTSVAGLWDLLATTYGSRAPITEVPKGRRPGATNLMRLVADNTRARSMLGWSPVTPLEKGLRITVESLSLA